MLNKEYKNKRFNTKDGSNKIEKDEYTKKKQPKKNRELYFINVQRKTECDNEPSNNRVEENYKKYKYTQDTDLIAVEKLKRISI